MTGRPPQSCGRCGATDVRPYAVGYRCPLHTPAAIAGLPEPGEGRYCASQRCHCGACPWWTPRDENDHHAPMTAIDTAHVLSGKRRSSPHVHAGAKATRATLERTNTA